MNAFAPYSIPIMGLKADLYHYRFSLDNDFFALFEASLVEEGKIDFEVHLDKRADMIVIDFEMQGTVRAECDRCTAMIDLPLQDVRQLIVKYGEAEGEEEDEVVFIHRETSDFNLAQYLYEFTILALPIRNIYDCQNGPTPPCNREVLAFLEKESEEDTPANVWDSLKDLNKDN